MEVLLHGGVVTGVIDFVTAEQDGSLVVRDWKANVHEAFIGRYARQLQFYVHALRTQQQTVCRAEIVDVAATTRARKLITTDIDIGQTTISRLIEHCQHAIQSIRRGVFLPKPSADVCGRCDVRRICKVRKGV